MQTYDISPISALSDYNIRSGCHRKEVDDVNLPYSLYPNDSINLWATYPYKREVERTVDR